MREHKIKLYKNGPILAECFVPNRRILVRELPDGSLTFEFIHVLSAEEKANYETKPETFVAASSRVLKHRMKVQTFNTGIRLSKASVSGLTAVLYAIAHNPRKPKP